MTTAVFVLVAFYAGRRWERRKNRKALECSRNRQLILESLLLGKERIAL